jgi:uncharacterized membrane protein (UPF0127 family)
MAAVPRGGMTARRHLAVRLISGLLLAAWLGLPAWALGQEVSEYGNPWLRVTVGPVTVQAEAVRTPERLYQGLSHRRELPAGRGMLFFMPELEVQTFCMRGMRFPLDLIWISEGRVAGITRNVPPTRINCALIPVPGRLRPCRHPCQARRIGLYSRKNWGCRRCSQTWTKR